MKRRAFISLLGGAATWPLAARAQQGGGMRRIGVLMGYAESDLDAQTKIAAFREGLHPGGDRIAARGGRDYHVEHAEWSRLASLQRRWLRRRRI